MWSGYKGAVHTLVPGWELDEECEPCCGEESSLIVSDLALAEVIDEGDEAEYVSSTPLSVRVRVEHSIIGTIQVQRDEVGAEPVQISVSDSIVDATSSTRNAIEAPNNRHAHAMLSIVRSTVIGITRVHAIRLGENTLFEGLVQVARRQIGCLRFCYVPPGSRTPRRYACQPDLDGPGVVPTFMSLRYGSPHYCRLADDCALQIRQGADDQAEVGVYHDLYQPQREANLRQRLAEFMPLAWNRSICSMRVSSALLCLFNR